MIPKLQYLSGDMLDDTTCTTVLFIATAVITSNSASFDPVDLQLALKLKMASWFSSTTYVFMVLTYLLHGAESFLRS